MPVFHLDKLFRPRRIAVVGASARPGSVGAIVLRNLIRSGFEGPVYPVNPKHEAIQSVPAYATVAQLPHVPDLAILCTPADTTAGLVRQCGEAGIGALAILSAGFREIGPAGASLENDVRQAAAPFPGTRILGPNSLGFIVPRLRLNASFASYTPKEGGVAFVSQSGALCTSVLDWAKTQNLGFSCFVSVGNMLDVSISDLIDYLATDNYTQSVVLYIESVVNARPFMSAARAFSRSKPIIVYKAGRFAASAQAAASHTGALAGVDAVYDAALKRAGITRVFETQEMFDCAELLAFTPRRVSGSRLAVVTNAGGPGVMAVDALLSMGGALAEISPEIHEKLNDVLPASWSHGNPVDVQGDADAQRFRATLDAVLVDAGVDGALVILAPQALTDPTGTAEQIVQVAAHSRKPILTCWMGDELVAEGRRVFYRHGVPSFPTPERAVKAFMRLVSHSRQLEMLYETPADVPLTLPLNRQRLREQIERVSSVAPRMLSEVDAKSLLEAYGIPAALPQPAASDAEAVEVAERIGYPVVLKINSPDITHKTDAGGVALDLATADAVRAAFGRVLANAQRHHPEARIDGVTVQRMHSTSDAVELIVGTKRDPVFGAVILVGMGGVAAELHGDISLELPPLSERLARRMLSSLRSWPLLEGYRGRPPVNVEQLIEVMIRISYLIADAPEIVELDINPLLVTPQTVVALDARMLLGPGEAATRLRPYPHLAIRPYPVEWMRDARLRDGTPVTLRPVRPEDEPEWRRLLTSCSPTSIWFRFRYLFKEATHEMATRYCFIDYDRELAIVAEVRDDDGARLAGVGRLVADADHLQAEYAVLVADRWQGLGLGGQLTDYCLEICREWGVDEVVAETDPSNHRMMRIFRSRGFNVAERPAPDVVLVVKRLGAASATNVKNPAAITGPSAVEEGPP